MLFQGLLMQRFKINSTSPVLPSLNWNHRLRSGWSPELFRYQIPTAISFPCDFSMPSRKFGALGDGPQGKLVSWRYCSWHQPGKRELLQQSRSCRTQSRSIALQTFINIQKTNVDSVVFVSFSFYPLQTSQLCSRVCVNTWGKLSLTTTSPQDKMHSGITQCWQACIAIQQRSWSNSLHMAEGAAQSEHWHLGSPPSHWTARGLSFQVKSSVMRNGPYPHILSTVRVASTG